MSYLLRLYDTSPIRLQSLLCNLEGARILRRRFGRAFRESLSFLQDSQWWPYGRQRAYQDEKLRMIVEHAYTTVPYYRELFDRLGLVPEDIRGVEDLKLLPVMTKADVIAAGDRMISTAVQPKKRCQGYTSGTTGSSLRVVTTPATTAMRWAIWWRHRMRFGLHFGDPHVQFTAQHIVPFAQKAPPFYRRVRPLNQLRVSLAHMAPGQIESIISYLEQGGWRYYAGYPSAVYLLADHLRMQQRQLENGPQFFVSGAESLLPNQVELISRWLNCKVIDQYGLAESVANISQCELGSYHVDMEYGIVEKNHVISESAQGKACKIIGTALHNMAMPLLRYDTGDVMTIGTGICACGRQSPVVESIDGRIESYVVTPTGRRLGRLMTVFKDMTAIRQAQIVQDDIESIIVRIVKHPSFCQMDEAKLMDNFRMRVGDELQIKLQYMEKLDLPPGKKFRAVVSSVDHSIRADLK